MKKLLALIFCIVLIFTSSMAFAAGTCAVATQTTVRSVADSSRILDIVKYTWTWTADGSGVVSGEGGTAISGIIVGVQFVWVDASNLYDVVVVETNGSADVLEGVGANLAQSTTNRTPITTDEKFVPLIKSTLTPGVTGAGAAATGSIVLYVIQ